MSRTPVPSLWSRHADLVGVVRDLGEQSFAVGLDTRFIEGRDNTNTLRPMIDVGLFGLTIPQRYGGLGRDYTALATVCEELGAIDTAYQVSLTVHLALVSMCILQWGSEQQRADWLPALTSGKRVATFGLTEPGTGSDVAALCTRATPVDGGFVLNGEKSWISAASQANLFLLFATVDSSLRHKGITAFIVPRESAGLSTTVLPGKFGLRTGDTGTVVCRDVFVPSGAVLGEVGEGFAVALSALGNGLFTVGCGALGIARASREWTAEYLRRAGAKGQGWEARVLAEMVAREDVVRLLLARAATLKDAGKLNAQETGLAKWRAADAAYANTEGALRIWETHETGENLTLSRYLANAKGAVIYGGTAEIHQTMQGAFALGDRVERPFRIPSPAATKLR